MKQTLLSRAVLGIVATAIITRVIYIKLTTDPVWAVKGYALLNFLFDNAADFNLKEHRYLAGAYRPVQEETFKYPTEIVSGSIPSDLNGVFARIGPNPIPERLSHGYHWFDGDGMLHAIRIKGGRATYSNQFIQTRNYELTKKYGGVVTPQLGELRGIIGLVKIFYDKLILKKAIPLPDLEDGTANTAFTHFKDRVFLGYESNLPFEIIWNERTHSFSSLGFQDFDGSLNYPFTAHPKVDPEDDNLYFINYSFDPELGPMKYGRMNSQFTVTSYFNISLSIPTMVHDMMITKNYVLVFDSSIVFDRKGIFKGEFLTMNQSKPFRVGLLPKTATSDKEIQWFTFENQPFGLIHALNAWEDDSTNEVIFFTPLTKEFNSFDPRKPTSANSYQMYEIRLNYVTGQFSLRLFSSESESMLVEFPNVHPHYLGRKSKFGFSGELLPDLRQFHSIVKFDLFERKIENKIVLPEGWICGEPVLIPRERKEGEDAEDLSDFVYLAVFATNLQTEESHWIVFDGETMNNEPVVRIRIPKKRIPLGFHGIWISEEKLHRHRIKWANERSADPPTFI
jgi:carotenoid cleavage dioxygenase-like enzyme